VVATAGTGAVFLLNAASFLGVLVVLSRWQRAPSASQLPPEHVLSAIRAGMRYVRHAPLLSAALVRIGIFMLCGTALWALLPLVAQQELGLDAVGYGGLLGCMGIGAVAGGALLPHVHRRVASDPLVAGATVMFAVATVALASVQNFVVVSAAMVVGGLAWTMLMSTFTIAVQTDVPAWVRARAVALFMLVLQGGMAVGSALWGAVATHTGLPIALLGAASGLILGLAAMVRYHLQTVDSMDMMPLLYWDKPVTVRPPRPDAGPVLVTVEYRIAPDQAREFARAMRAMRRLRRRDGATRWGLFHNMADPGRHLETFVVESWAEHLRQHERTTVADQEMQSRIRAFHMGDTPPIVSHFLSAYAWKDTR
jgi:Transmembrane secretion effector